VKIELGGYHKIMIFAQHWFTPNGDLKPNYIHAAKLGTKMK
jgi:hypothetical protein